jgi:hypothetical protein
MMKNVIPIALLAFVSFSCHYDGIAPLAPNWPAVFTYAPLDKSSITSILPLGWVDPPGHTLPTDHVYFGFNRPPAGSTGLPVYAPGNGVVSQVISKPLNNVPESLVFVKMNDKVTYYLDHIVLNDSVKQGYVVKAGHRIATTGVGCDFGIIDYSVSLSFANPKRYSDQILYCGKPLTYFADSLKSFLYSKVDRDGSDKDGRIDIDLIGRLVGNWFLDGPTFVDGPDTWSKELSFAYDFQHPSIVWVSIGGTLALAGKWGIASDAIDPANVSVSSGKIAYGLLTLHDQVVTQAGLMILEMTDDTHLKIEVFPGSQDSTAEFDSNAFVYAR